MIAGRSVILVGAPLAGLATLAEAAIAAGAAGVWLVGTGTAPPPWEERASSVKRPLGGEPVLAATTLRALPQPVRDDLDRFDPQREAIVIGSNFYEADVLAGRRYVGGRRRIWRALENKTTVDELWDTLGVARPPSTVVPTEAAVLREAAGRLDEGRGTVWSGDNAGQPSANGDLVRWVRTPAQADGAATLLSAACPTARIAPWVDGVPCSIHAFVTDRGAAVFRPVEIVMLRRPDGSFLYAGIGTWWDPPTETRVEMRDIARRVAAHLSRTIGYRGMFGIDGIAGPDGFLPTELNARWTAGIYPIAGPTGINEMRLLECCITDGLDGPVDELEAAVLSAADGRRWGGPTLNGRVARQHGFRLLAADGAETTFDEEAVAVVTVRGQGSNAEVMVRPTRPPTRWIGPSMAAIGVHAFSLADREMGTDIGPALSWDQP
jgi:hypothetical protein